MNVIKTAIDGVVIIEPRLFKDDRGYFFESFSNCWLLAISLLAFSKSVSSDLFLVQSFNL